jgi:hypothetical protein
MPEIVKSRKSTQRYRGIGRNVFFTMSHLYCSIGAVLIKRKLFYTLCIFSTFIPFASSLSPRSGLGTALLLRMKKIPNSADKVLQ